MKKLIVILLMLFMVSTASAEVVDWVEDIQDNPLSFWLQPYSVLLGGISFFYAFLFSIIGIAIYMHNNNLALVSGYFLLVAVFGAVLLPMTLMTVIGIIAALAITSLLYYALVVKRRK